MDTQTIAGCCETATDQAHDVIENYPTESVLVAFTAGALVGLAIGTAMATSANSGAWRNRRVAEGLGSRLMDSLDNILPRSLADSFHKS